MPVYSYRCESCGIQIDRQQRFNDPPLTTCPECGEEALRKTFQPVGIVFKGSGFYATDHRSPSGQTPAKKAEKTETKAEKASAPASTDES
jgi:putative FmdB family regulatory protein